MKCLMPDCSLESITRDDPGYCRKHTEARKLVARKASIVEEVKVIPRIINDEFLLCFPEREVKEGRMRAWELVGPKTVSEYDYMFGRAPKSNYEQEQFKELILQYQRIFKVAIRETHSWTNYQKKSVLGTYTYRGELNEITNTETTR